MTKLLLAALIAASLSAAPSKSTVHQKDLTAGRYDVRVTGLLCTTCARAIKEAFEKIESIESVEPDYAHGRLIITVSIDSNVSVSSLRRALRKATRRIRLPTKFRLASVEYITGL